MRTRTCVSKKTENDEEICTDGKKFTLYLVRAQIKRLLRSFISQTISKEIVRKRYLKMGICTSLQNKRKTRTSKHVRTFVNQHFRCRYITNFLPPAAHTYLCVSGVKKCSFFGKFCVHTK